MVLTLPADQGLRFLESCLVEGDPESEERARRGKQRALALSIALQISRYGWRDAIPRCNFRRPAPGSFGARRRLGVALAPHDPQWSSC